MSGLPNFQDVEEHSELISIKAGPLEKSATAVDLERFRPILERFAGCLRVVHGGRPPWRKPDLERQHLSQCLGRYRVSLGAKRGLASQPGRTRPTEQCPLEVVELSAGPISPLRKLKSDLMSAQTDLCRAVKSFQPHLRSTRPRNPVVSEMFI